MQRKADAAWKVAYAAETRFLETPARTMAGLLFKLRFGCEPWNYGFEYPDTGDQPSGPPAVLATLQDLECLVGDVEVPYPSNTGSETWRFPYPTV